MTTAPAMFVAVLAVAVAVVLSALLNRRASAPEVVENFASIRIH
ncbi:hypothetical protein [Streptosporangium sp. G12]